MVANRQNTIPFTFERYSDDAMNLRVQHCLSKCPIVIQAIHNWCKMHEWLEGLSATAFTAPLFKIKTVPRAKRAISMINALLSAHYSRCSSTPLLPSDTTTSQRCRSLLNHRFVLTQILAITKRLICLLLDQYPQICNKKSRSKWFTPDGIDWFWQVELWRYDRYIMDSYLTLVDYIQQQIKQIDYLLDIQPTFCFAGFQQSSFKVL